MTTRAPRVAAIAPPAARDEGGERASVVPLRRRAASPPGGEPVPATENRRIPRPAPPGASRPGPDDPAVAAHLRHIALMDDRADQTVYARRRALARLARFLHPVLLLDATPELLADWRASLRPLARNSVTSYVSHVRQFYAWADAEGLVSADPARWPRRWPPRPAGCCCGCC
jgi:hypothetical protein